MTSQKPSSPASAVSMGRLAALGCQLLEWCSLPSQLETISPFKATQGLISFQACFNWSSSTFPRRHMFIHKMRAMALLYPLGEGWPLWGKWVSLAQVTVLEWSEEAEDRAPKIQPGNSRNPSPAYSLGSPEKAQGSAGPLKSPDVGVSFINQWNLLISLVK